MGLQGGSLGMFRGHLTMEWNTGRINHPHLLAIVMLIGLEVRMTVEAHLGMLSVLVVEVFHGHH